jgi:Flp pilus assembly protein TadG
MGKLTRATRRGAGIRGENGATLVEFALILPILITFLFGIVEFGRLLNIQVMVTSAAREGARFASLGSSATAVTTQVKASCPTVDPTKLTVAVTNAAGASGSAATVRVTYSLDLATQTVARMFGSTTVNVSHVAVMRIE